MKKSYKFISILLFTFILSFTPLFSLSNEILKVDLQQEFGILHGSISEYVFEDVIRNTDNMESRLDWDISAIPYTGLSAEFTLFKHFLVGINGIIGIPVNSGKMQDYDWLNSIGGANGTHKDWIDEDPCELTNYSIHDNHLDQYYRLNFELGGNITPFDFLSISPVISYQYSIIQFSGSNGYKEYKDDNFIKQTFDGKVISYAVETNSFCFGLKTDFTPLKCLNIDADVYYSPKLTYIETLDRHFLGSVAFYDKINGTSLVRTDLNIQYVFKEAHRLGVKCGFEYIPVSCGQDYQKPLDRDGNPNKTFSWGNPTGAEGGVSETLWNWSVIYTCRF